jgi:hypothetical protein
VLEEQWRSTAGDERWRRPWRHVVIPGEGPANTGKQGAHEHRGSAGMLSSNLIWSETEQKVGIDGEVGRVLTGGDGGRHSTG